MNKKTLLYFKNINMDKTNLSYLKKKFKLKENVIFKNRRNYNIIITPHIGGSTKDA
tara:strand:- start:180 stop:347 length:168 start_codon:yes stop_codon:yes gene_type:complete